MAIPVYGSVWFNLDDCYWASCKLLLIWSPINEINWLFHWWALNTANTYSQDFNVLTVNILHYMRLSESVLRYFEELQLRIFWCWDCASILYAHEWHINFRVLSTLLSLASTERKKSILYEIWISLLHLKKQIKILSVMYW